MDEVKILVKPDSVSWDEIHDIVYSAHSSNRAKGVDIANAHKNGEEIQELLGEKGVCFVAMLGDKVIATSSVAFHDVDRWWYKGVAGYATLAAVLPEYKGMHLFTKLEQTRVEYARNAGAEVFYGDTAQHNTKRRAIAKKDGYYEVTLGRTSFNKHNYVVIVKWLNKCPFSPFYIKLKFIMSAIKVYIKMMLGR